MEIMNNFYALKDAVAPMESEATVDISIKGVCAFPIDGIGPIQGDPAVADSNITFTYEYLW